MDPSIPALALAAKMIVVTAAHGAAPDRPPIWVVVALAGVGPL